MGASQVAQEGYFAANAALNTVFFDGRFAGQPVYLSLDRNMRAELASKLGGDGRDLEQLICNAVKHYLEPHGDPYGRVLKHAVDWQRRGMLGMPPCTALLFSLSHAAALMAADGNYSGANYYGRVVGLLGLDRTRFGQYAASSSTLWSALNAWLVQNNFQRGRPTAFAINTWKHAGLAISQAIVREVDREEFHEMFEKSGFSGHEHLTESEATFYLSEWFRRGRANKHLASAWKKDDLKPRIAAAAVAELGAWSRALSKGAGAAGVAGKVAKLSLVANLVSRFTGRAIDIHMGLRGDDERRGPFRSSAGQSFYLANESFGNFVTVSPSPVRGSEKALLQDFVLATESGSAPAFQWQPRPVIPLVQTEQSSLWAEVSRVGFGSAHMVLVRDLNNLPRRVEQYLAAATLGEPSVERYGELKGLPQGWVLFSNVRVGRAMTAPAQELECLVPLDDSPAVLEVVSGMQLLRDIYHAHSPVEARFLAISGPTAILAKTSNGAGERVVLEARSDSQECALQVPPPQMVGVQDLRFEGQLGKDGNVVAEQEVYLRTADYPNLPAKENLRGFAYSSVWSAGRLEVIPSLSVTGMVVHGTPASHELGEQEVAANAPPGGSGEDLLEEEVEQGSTPALATHACMERGYHVWQCQAFERGMNPSRPMWQECSACKQQLVTKARGKRTAAAEPAVPVARRLGQPRPRLVNTEVNYDAVLDALCFLGTGSRGKLEAILNLEEDDSRRPREILHDLFLLGFLDLEIRPGSNQVKSWAVAPPSLNFVSGSRAFLAGFRSAAFIEKIRKACQNIGGNLVEVDRPGRPRAIWLEGLDHARAKAALGDAKDPFGRALVATESAGQRLALACASLGGLKGALRPVSIGQPRNLQRFDVASAKWRPAAALGEAGAYRWNDGAQTYAYRDKEGADWIGPYQVVKLLAARAASVRVHSYSTGSKAFASTLGCEPPGLLERALVACSGELPTKSNGLAVYGDVLEDVALVILSQKYLGEIET